MPITVEAYAQYLTAQVAQMRGLDHDGIVFVNALKGRPFTNYATIKMPGGGLRTITPQHPEVASEIFVEWARGRILARRQQFGGPICLVPVPNKVALFSAIGQSFPTLVLAEQLMKLFRGNVHVHPALRWGRQLQKAQDGGPRDAWELYPELMFVPPPVGAPTLMVLVDDVCTSGGHLQACAAKLTASGCVVDYAVCGAKTFHDQQPDPFLLPPITLDDYVPGSNPFGFTPVSP